jgi:murein tripeptide amidase MpaA
MKNYLLTILIILLLGGFSTAQNYKQVKIHINSPADVTILQNSGMEFDHPVMTRDNAIVVFLSESDFDRLLTTEFNYEILIDDWFDYYNNLPKLTDMQKQNFIQESKIRYNVDDFGFGSMGGFYTFQEVVDELDEMYTQYPNLITEKFSIGTSVEGRTIWAVKLSDNPNLNESEPSVGFDALIHAREPASMATQMYFIWYMLENYGIDPEVTYLLDNREIYCTPVFNPDGYERNRQTDPNGGGMWRKNRRDNGGGCFGIDMNRNFSYQWGYDNLGSSPDPCSNTYRGPSAFSEPESEAVSNFVIGKNISTYFNMHAYSNAFLYPWGYITQACPDEEIYIDFSSDMSAINGFVYGVSGSILGYNSNGSVRDWLYGEQTVKNKIFGYTMEIGTSDDYFWPPQNRIFPIVQNSLGSLMYNTWVAGDYVLLENANFGQQYFNPGDLVELSPSFKNKGLHSANNISVELTSASSYVNISNGSVSFDSIGARSFISVQTPLSFSLASNTPVEEMIDLVLTVKTNGMFMSENIVSIIVGTPIFVFTDTTNNPEDFWTITATPSNPKWEATTSTFYSTPNSYTDSKNGNYVNNATVTMTLIDPVDLSGYTNPRLSFWTKFDIESNYDYGQVEISSDNGSSWTPLEGMYTEPATGNFQPNGEPVYDGIQMNWVKENISLSGLTSDEVKIRFELKTDQDLTKDGWYVDDVGIIIYTTVPVEDASINSLNDYELDQNFPNPFNPSTRIKYAIPNPGNVTVKIYNILGTELATLVDEFKPAGRYEVLFNLKDYGNSMGSGVYFYKITSGSFTMTKKMVILK